MIRQVFDYLKKSSHYNEEVSNGIIWNPMMFRRFLPAQFYRLIQPENLAALSTYSELYPGCIPLIYKRVYIPRTIAYSKHVSFSRDIPDAIIEAYKDGDSEKFLHRMSKLSPCQVAIKVIPSAEDQDNFIDKGFDIVDKIFSLTMFAGSMFQMTEFRNYWTTTWTSYFMSWDDETQSVYNRFKDIIPATFKDVFEKANDTIKTLYDKGGILEAYLLEGLFFATLDFMCYWKHADETSVVYELESILASDISISVLDTYRQKWEDAGLNEYMKTFSYML